MNKFCFKTVFSARLGTLVAVGEHANSQGKANGAHGAASPGAEPPGLARSMSRFMGLLTASFVWVALAWSQPAINALPKGGQVAQGAVQFSQSAQQLQITQSSDRAAVNWQSFDIGAAAKVNVVQPSAQAVLLNRVGGTAPSQIFGQLQANGKVILVNPNGMVFGQDGSVSAAAFTASTLNISDADFMAGNERYTRDGATGAIVNRGLIQAAPGGYVALLGASVSNEGQIVAPQGNVYMAAADAVTLPARAVAMPMGSSGRIRLELTPASINAAVANQKGGTIVTEGGQVYLQAAALNQAMATVLQSGSIDTTGGQGGQVHVLADGGRIRVDGQIKANSTNGTAGGDIYIGRDKDTNVLAAVGDVSGAQLESKGGFVETSGGYLATDGVSVKAAEWLLDPYNITIASSLPSGTAYSSNYTSVADSVILASDIVANLNAGTSVSIQTGAGGASAGDISVNADIVKASGAMASLTLTAHRDVLLSSSIKTTSSDLNINLNALTGKVTGAGGLAAGSGGLITVNTATNGELSGIIESGALLKTGAGQTKLSAMSGGTNTFAGGITISQGTLLLGNGNGRYDRTAGAGAITLGDVNTGSSNVSLLLEKGKDASQDSGKLTRTVTVTSNGTGTATLGGVVGSAGGSGWTAFGGALALNKNIIFSDETGDRTSLDGLITGTGHITAVSGRSIMASPFQNTWTGNYTVNTGTVLQLNSDKALSVNNNLINNGTVRLNGGATLHINALTGSGNLNLQNLGVSGNSTLNIGGGNGGGVFSGTLTQSSGVLSLVKNGTGTQTLSGVNTYTGTTTISGGNLQIGNAGTTGTLGTGAVTNNAMLTFNRSNDMTVANAISGSGGLTQSGGGTTTLTASNTYTGTTTITGGNLQIGNAGTSGTLGTGAVTNNATLTFNRSNDMTVANAISGSGGLTQSGGGTTTLTAANTFTGTTLVSGGGLALGHVNALQNSTLDTGTSGAQQVTFTAVGTNTYNIGALQGADDLAAGANSISAGANNASTTYSGVVSGTGNFSKVGNGSQILSGNNSYSGTTTVSGGTLQIGSGGGTGSLGVGAVSLSNSSTLRFVRNVDTVLANAVSGSGNLSATITGAGSDFDLGANVNLTHTGSTINLNVAGAITQSTGSVAATSLLMTAGENIGAANKHIETSVGSVALDSAGDQFLTEANNIIVSARTTANGNIHISTTNGTLNAGSFNGVSGITAGGTGNISLSGNTASGHGLNLSSNVSASNGDVTLSGTTSSSGTGAAPASGVYSSARVSANNITMTATAAGSTGHVLGYYGAGGQFIASGSLALSGTSDSATGNGFYSFTGAMSSGTGITINGTSNNGQAVGLDANVSLTNTSGDIAITGEAKGSNNQAIGLRGSSITNNGGSIRLIASKGNVFTNSVNGAGGNWGVEAPGAPLLNTLRSNGTGVVEIFAGTLAADTGAIDGKAMTIHQNANVGVLVKTAGAGNVTAPKVINAGTGDVRVAAGAVLSAGDGSGGQVLTVAGNTVSQTHATTPGKTYVYSGRAIGTGVLSRFGSYFNTLHYNGSTHDLNAAFGSAFGATLLGESSTQVLFREAVTSAPGFALNMAGLNLSKIYGAADPDALVGLSASYAGPQMLTNSVAGVGGSHVFGLAAADALATLSGTRAAGENASTTPYAFSLTSTGLNTSVSGQAGLLILKKTLSAALQGTVSKVYDGTDAANNLSNANFALTGWVTLNGVTDGANVTQTSGSYASKEVANNMGGAGSVSADLSAGHFVPSGTTLLSNYTLPTVATGNVGTITRAPLTVQVGSSTMFVTQDPQLAADTGIRYEGLKNGELPNDVLGALTPNYSGPATPGVGNYSSVYGLTSAPTAANYAVTVQPGSLNVLAADKLLIRLGGRSATYGDVTAANAGHTSAGQGISALYCVGGVNCNTISTLTMSDLGGGQWQATDTLGSSIRLTTQVNTTGQTSAAGFLNAGNHDYAVGSWSVQGGQNFTDLVLAAGALVITPKTLSLNAANVFKVYDGTKALAGMRLLPGGAMPGDDVGMVSNGGSFASKNAGSQAFTLSGLQLEGVDRGNYSFVSGNVSGTGLITPRQIAASFGALDKVYDGNTTANLTGGSLSGVILGDDVSVIGASAAFADPNVARDASGQVLAKSVQMADVSLGGVDGANYQLNVTVGTARITPKTVTSTVLAEDKVYDGLTSAIASAITTGVIGTDEVGVALGSANFANKNVARNANGQVTDQTVTVTGLRLTGALAGNYELSNTSATDVAKISPKLLAPSAAVFDKVYDGQAGAVLSGLGGIGLLPGDAVNFAASGAQFASPNVARNSQGQVLAQEVSVKGLRLMGQDAGNYVLQGEVDSFKTMATIEPRPLSIDAKALDKVYDGTTDVQLKWSQVNGWVAQERLGFSARAAFETPMVGVNKSVSVHYSLTDGVNGASASNYVLAAQSLSASILSSQVNKSIQKEITPLTAETGANKVSFVRTGSAAAMGVQPSSAEAATEAASGAATASAACLSDRVENCDCDETLVVGVQLCYVPRNAPGTTAERGLNN